MCTTNDLHCSSDELFKLCGIPAGQIIKIRTCIDSFGVENHDHAVTSDSDVNNLVELQQVSETSIVTAVQNGLSEKCDDTLTHSESETVSHVNPLPAFNTNVQIPNDKWLGTFKLPTQLSSSVIANLQNGHLPGNVRNEFTRDICSAIRVHTMNPTKHQRNHVAFMITQTYPFLADKIGSGTASWEQAIKYRFKNIRKRKISASPNACASASSSSQSKQQKQQRGTSNDTTHGETDATIKEHVTTMKKEMGKVTNKNLTLVKELMDVTYCSRRNNILSNPVSIKETVKMYPALKLVSELRAEFERNMGSKHATRGMVDIFKNEWQPKIIKLARTKNALRTLVKEMDEAVQDEINNFYIEGNFSILFLKMFLQERSGSAKKEAVVKMCSEDESIDQMIKETITPMLIGSGSCDSIDPLYIVAEGEIVLVIPRSMNLVQSVVLLIGVYYVFNIEYPREGKNFFTFIEAVLMDKCDVAKKRLAVNKVLQDLDTV